MRFKGNPAPQKGNSNPGKGRAQAEAGEGQRAGGTEARPSLELWGHRTFQSLARQDGVSQGTLNSAKPRELGRELPFLTSCLSAPFLRPPSPRAPSPRPVAKLNLSLGLVSPFHLFMEKEKKNPPSLCSWNTSTPGQRSVLGTKRAHLHTHFEDSGRRYVPNPIPGFPSRAAEAPSGRPFLSREPAGRGSLAPEQPSRSAQPPPRHPALHAPP